MWAAVPARRGRSRQRQKVGEGSSAGVGRVALGGRKAVLLSTVRGGEASA